MSAPESLRRTGRTTRLLEKAAALAKEGRAVYVVVVDRRYAKQLAHEFARREGGDLGVKFETPEELGNFNWETMTLRGAHPNCAVLIDHYTIEARWAPLLRALHEFDA